MFFFTGICTAFFFLLCKELQHSPIHVNGVRIARLPGAPLCRENVVDAAPQQEFSRSVRVPETGPPPLIKFYGIFLG